MPGLVIGVDISSAGIERGRLAHWGAVHSQGLQRVTRQIREASLRVPSGLTSRSLDSTVTSGLEGPTSLDDRSR
jgi:hypothetical protein